MQSEERRRIHTFPKSISAIVRQSCQRFEVELLNAFYMTLTVTLILHPNCGVSVKRNNRYSLTLLCYFSVQSARIHRLHLWRGVRHSRTSVLDICWVIPELWKMRSIPSWPSLPDPPWPGVVASERVLFMGQIELFDNQTECKQMTDAELNC